MFTFCHAPLKTALLIHKMAKVPYSFSETVFIFLPITMSRFSNTSLVRRLRLQTSGGIANLSGFGGYSPIPPRHASAIVSMSGFDVT